jgi:acetyltransferase-like isoleucine patch superfamily enzyme
MSNETRSSIEIKVNQEYVRLGKDAIIEEAVLLGYLPNRRVENTLMIGPGAHIRSGSVIYGGSRIGSNLETGHNVVIREENNIGDNLRIWNNSVIDYGCTIGSNVRIHNKVYIAQFTIIEDQVFVGPGATFANDIHPGCPDALKCMRGPCINKGAQIGINCCILPRVVIGEWSVIGAGSVVTRDIPPGVVAYGNPAQVICDITDIKCTTGLREKPYDHLGERI